MAVLTISTRLLGYDPGHRAFSQEVSTLGANLVGQETALQSMPRVQINLVSHKTGKVLAFRYQLTMYTGPSHEREVGGWRFRNDAENLDLVIFND